ncbi:unnamed protein product, partial [Lymnaea stagnalis]
MTTKGNKIRQKNSTKGQHHTSPEPQLWSLLPATIVLAIYTYLGDIDRVSMARVCKTWYQVFQVPALWRSRIMRFSGKRSQGDIKSELWLKSKFASPRSYGQQAIKFAKQFSTSVQEITVHFLLLSELRESANLFRELSTCLDEASLRYIYISGLGLEGVRGQIRKDLTDSLKRLIEKQHSLRKFRIKSSHFDLESGLQILQCLAGASAQTITDLALNGLFQNGVSLYRE